MAAFGSGRQSGRPDRQRKRQTNRGFLASNWYAQRGYRKGIEEIMTRRTLSGFSCALAVSATLILAGLITARQIRPQSPAAPVARPSFEVASIKPNTSGINMVRIMAPPNGSSKRRQAHGHKRKPGNADHVCVQNQKFRAYGWARLDEFREVRYHRQGRRRQQW
jgi:hypothetical protein